MDRRTMEIAKASRSIARAEDVRNDTKLIMQPYANWEQFLTPAPISISILAELVFISSKDDFSINRNPPPDGFKFIRYPDSFRACLMQVVNAGWNAFNEAHTNMDQIRLHSGNVGGYVKNAVQLLMQEDDQLIQMALPDQLATIKDIAVTCTALSKSTEERFVTVMHLIEELMEASINAKAAYGEELEETKRIIAENKLKQKAAEESKRRSEESLKQMNKQLAEAQEMYKKSMESIPTGWEVIGMNFVEGISESITSILNGYAIRTTMRINSTQEEMVDPNASNAAYSKSGQILGLVNGISSYVKDGQIKWDELYDRRQDKSKAAFIQAQFEQVADSVKKYNKCKPAIHCLDICKKAIDICQTMASIQPGMTVDGKVASKLINDLESLREMSAKFDTESKAYTGSSAFSMTPPQLAKCQQNDSMKAGNLAVENARFRVEQANAQLRQVQDMVHTTTDAMEKSQHELTEIMVKLQNCNVKEINFSDTIKMLVMGLDAMGRVKEQWAKLIRFFQMIANIIDVNMRRSLEDFVSSAQKPIGQLNYSSKQFMMDTLYKLAFQSSNIASLVTMIAGTYYEVSNKFVMDGVSSLGKLMAMDPTMPGFNMERQQLQNGCKAASEGIMLLVKKNKRDFDMKTAARIAKIESELQAVLPPASESEMKKIKCIVDSGMKAVSAEDEDQYM